jgi:type IV pilus assembly protein PilQ
MVNLPVANPAGRLALTLLDSDYIVDLELSAAQAEGRGEIISSPRLITANQREATIEQGVEFRIRNPPRPVRPRPSSRRPCCR